MSAPSTSTFYERKNNAKTTITNNPLSDSGTSITLAAGTGAKFPSSGTWLATLWDDTTYPLNPTADPNMEVVLVTSRSTDTLTVTRAQSGTTGVAHASGSAIGLLIMDEALDQHETAITDLETVAYRTGWIPAGVTFTYSSVDDPTGVITTSTDISSILSVGMRIRFVNGGNTIYGIITAISGTTITFLHEIDPSDSLALALMANSAITAPFFSYHKAPYGFPVDPRKWTVQLRDTSQRLQASPVQNTWYNLGSLSLSIPIGVWNTSFQVSVDVVGASTAEYAMHATLSTANNSESDADFTGRVYATFNATAGTTEGMATINKQKFLALASKTPYYANAKCSTTSGNSIRFDGAQIPTIVRATLAYL